MAIKYTITRVKNQHTGKPIYYPLARLNGTKTIDDIASDIESRTTIDTAEVKGILCELERVIYKNLAEGNSVRLGDIGSFHLGITSSQGVDTADDVTVNNVKCTHIHFTPSAKLQSIFSTDALASGGTGEVSIRFERAADNEA